MRQTRRTKSQRTARPFSEKTGNPALHSSEILAVRISEKLRKPCLVIARAPMEPREVKREHARGDPRVQRKYEPREKNQVTQIHRVAAVAVGPAGHEALRRIRKPGPAAALAQAVVADEAVLHVSPREQRQRPRIDPRNALLQGGLGSEERDRPGDKRAVRGAPQPPRSGVAGAAHAAAAPVLGMNRMKRFARTIVPARKWNVAVRPKPSATSPPRSGPIDEPSACAPKSTPMLVPPMFLGVVSRSQACITGRTA